MTTAPPRAARDSRDIGAAVRAYIDTHPDGDLSLDAIAAHFFISKYYLCRSFKASSGVTVHAYLNRRRVLRARELIASGITASEAAYRVGFGDYSAFYRAYVRQIGAPPSGTPRRG